MLITLCSNRQTKFGIWNVFLFLASASAICAVTYFLISPCRINDDSKLYTPETIVSSSQLNRTKELDDTGTPSHFQNQIEEDILVTALYEIKVKSDFRSGLEKYITAFEWLSQFVQQHNRSLIVFYDEGNLDLANRMKNVAMRNKKIQLEHYELNRTFAGHFRSKIETILQKMRTSPVRPNGLSDMLKYNQTIMSHYLVINHSKMHFLMSAAKLRPSIKILTWIDIGISRHKRCTTEMKPQFGCFQTSTARLPTGTSKFRSWPPYLNSIYLAGGRREVAAGILTFNREFLLKIFGPLYFSHLLFMIQRWEITTEQGLLTVLVQLFDNIDYVPTGYDSLIANMLTCGSRSKSYRELSLASKSSEDFNLKYLD